MKTFLCSILLLLCSAANAQREITDTVMGLHDHQADIVKAVYSMDGRRMITAGLDRQVFFYEAVNWIPLMSYSHYDQVSHVAISRDNSILASAAKDRSVKIYFMDSSKFLEFAMPVEITGLALDLGMRNAYVAMADGQIKIIDLKKGELIKRSFETNLPITTLTLTHNGFLVLGLKNGDIQIINNMGKVVNTMKGHGAEITSLHFAFYKNQPFIASGSEDKSVKVWDMRTFKLVKSIIAHEWTVNHVELSFDLKYVASAGKDGQAFIWDINTGEKVASVKSNGEAFKCISLSEKNEFVATAELVRDKKEFIVYIWKTGLYEEKPIKAVDPKKDAVAPKK